MRSADTPSEATSCQPAIRQTVRARVLRCSDGAATPSDDMVAVEEPLEMAVACNGEMTDIGVTLRTPGHERELLLGYLFCEGVIRSASDVDSIRLRTAQDATLPAQRVVAKLGPTATFDAEALRRSTPITAACGACGKSALEALRIRRVDPFSIGPERVAPEVLESLPRAVEAMQAGFQSTGGLHAAARFRFDGELAAHAEDIGRHNALDKLVGGELDRGRSDWSNSILFLSGRLGYDLMQKAIAIGCPLVASVGAPSSLALELASLLRVTVVGFLRGNRFNVYSEPGRIHFPDRE